MMHWSARHRAMLDAMGLRLWEAPASAQDVDDEAATQRRFATPRADAVAAPRTFTATAGATSAGSTATRPVAPATQSIASATTKGPSTPATAADVSSMDWTALRDAVASCTACGLCEGRTQTVFGCGNPNAHWMIIGEAPGEKEDLQGEPFVGKSGQLLDAMLRTLKLTREPTPSSQQVYIANTLKCRPPGNRNPMPAELAHCEPFLVRQVELVRPRIILAMGRFAVQALLHSSEPIGRLRGVVHRYHGIPLVVTYHPAYLLRNPLDKARVWDDLCLALSVLRKHGSG